MRAEIKKPGRAIDRAPVRDEVGETSRPLTSGVTLAAATDEDGHRARNYLSRMALPPLYSPAALRAARMPDQMIGPTSPPNASQ